MVLPTGLQLEKLADAIPGVAYQFLVSPGGGWKSIYVSLGVKRVLELSPEEVYADPDAVAQCVVPEDKARHRAAVEHALKTRTPWMHEHRIQTKSGVLKWVRGHAIPESQPDGSVLWNGTLVDVTEQERAEHALRSSEEKFRKAFELNPDSININRLDDGLFVSINRGFAQILGYTEEEIIGRTSMQLGMWDDPQARKPMVAMLRKDGAVTNFETRFRTRSGQLVHGLMSAAVIEIEGVPHMISVIRDITEEKRAKAERVRIEAQLRESQKMEALGTLAGGVAHDFNNALAMILGNLELARQDVGPGHAALVSLEEIGKASRRAKDLVQQILAFGRRQTLERTVISLAPVVVEAARLLRATLPAEVSLSVDCKADAPAVLADATQVKQVLLNLCSNALYAVQGMQERRGLIEIRLYGCTQLAPGGALLPGRHALLTVRDNGSGMDEATRSHVFEPFFTTKPVGKGTGLGLSVVHSIVEAHGASITVESVAAAGSEFRIYFPAVKMQAAEAAASAPGSARIDGEGKQVLYVDDEEAIVFLMTRLLERRGYRVSGYTDPHEAVAAARADPGRFHLVVTDYNMPGMSGLEVASAMREIRADLPVMLASGYITEELRQKAPAAGVRELIYKPNTVDELCAAVARCANAQRGDTSSS